ncbi:restriction endonuclease subunit S [Bacteroides congonensis]|uniref:restriction endonuclease subunit S n=1 Tax=Bacteroides congonensis TaxID=1871006 RepID=UPI002FDAD790
MELTKYKLRDLVDVTRGMSLSGQFYAEEGEFIRLTLGNFNMNGGGFKENTSKTDLYFTGTVKDEYILKKGDIITPLTEQSLGLLGTTARIPESWKYIQSQDVALVRCKRNRIDPNFCYYLISSNLVRQQLSAAAQQTKIRHTSPDKIMDCTVWIPNLENQIKIGRILTDIDNKIALNRAINDNLEKMAKQLYDYWFVQFDFPDENGRPYKSSGGTMAWNEKLKREIPKDWYVKSIGEFANVRKGTTITKAQTQNGSVKVVAAATSFSFLHNEANRSEYVITISSSGANAGYINFWREPIFASDCSTVQGNSIEITLYCYYWLLYFQETLFNQQIGAAQPHVYPEHISKIPIVIPPNHILNKIKDCMISINMQQHMIEQEIEELAKQRNELLPLLMNGQVSVNYHLSDD